MGYREVVVIGRIRRGWGTSGCGEVCGVEGERGVDWAGGRWRILFAGRAEVAPPGIVRESVEYGAGFGVDVELKAMREGRRGKLLRRDYF